MTETERRILRAKLLGAARELSLLGAKLDDDFAKQAVRLKICELEELAYKMCGGVPLKVGPHVQFDIFAYKRLGMSNADIAKRVGVSEITVYTKCNMYRK